MSSFEAKNENEQGEYRYNFSEIGQLEPGIKSVVEKLQEAVEGGKYDVLLSDDIGGRIPTLVLWEIIKRANPNKKLGVRFVASGKSYLPDPTEEGWSRLVDYLKNCIKPDSKVLLVTQYIHSGKTVSKLLRALQDAHINDVDIAAVESLNSEASLEKKLSNVGKVFTGTFYGPHIEFDEQQPKFTGVEKSKSFEPKPRLIQDVIERHGRGRFITQKEWAEIFGFEEGESREQFWNKVNDPGKNAKYDEQASQSLTEEELKELRENIKKAREDVKTLATNITRGIWGN